MSRRGEQASRSEEHASVARRAQQGERSDRVDSGASAAIVVQWDPERALGGDSGRHAFTHPLPAQRSLQMGLRGEATRLLAVADGIVAAITDVTSAFAAVGAALEAGEDASSLLPVERPYSLPEGCTIADRSVATAAAEVAVAQGERLGASQLERWLISYAWNANSTSTLTHHNSYLNVMEIMRQDP